MSEPLTNEELKALERIDIARGWTDGIPGGAGLCVRAVAEIRELLDDKKGLQKDIVRFNDKCVEIRRKLEANNAKLTAALEKYGQHEPRCRYVVTRDEHRCRKHLKLSEQKIEPCDCGLSDALAGKDDKTRQEQKGGSMPY